MNIDLYTIGFTQKKAREFFGKLQSAGVKRVLDVRLNNVSQLSGFAKRSDASAASTIAMRMSCRDWIQSNA